MIGKMRNDGMRSVGDTEHQRASFVENRGTMPISAQKEIVVVTPIGHRRRWTPEEDDPHADGIITEGSDRHRKTQAKSEALLPNSADPPLKELIKKGKKKVTYASAGGSTKEVDVEDEGDTSVTQELGLATERLCLSDKRKRGPETVFDFGPPMELQPKRTPKRGNLKPTKLSTRLTRSKTKAKTPGSIKRRSPVKTPLTARLKKKTPKKTPEVATPATRGVLRRLRFQDAVMKELKDLDATELQRVCKDEGVSYDGKIDAIFAIAEHRTRERFGLDVDEAPEIIEVADSVTGGGDKNAQQEG
ncbi:hypothetical protein CBR_g31241 [Chara braunii]|uniref:Uncharacterized protein n=1 Tax=Chara braunii TaxID=69332 RepID=A0A388JXU8_CHABU|nr:hypothetical protein CBR_g31241 [Chara braunii]|eukprot:GBG62605.1 hypothetical protein CBR_g31241 [Chara braunii]